MDAESIGIFAAIAQCDDAQASNALEAHEWDLQRAIDAFFARGMETLARDARASRVADDDDGSDGDDEWRRTRGETSRRRRKRAKEGERIEEEEEEEIEAIDSDSRDAIDLVSDGDDGDQDEAVMREVLAARERRDGFMGHWVRHGGREANDGFATRFERGARERAGVREDVDMDSFDLPDGIDREEAAMLEAAMLGVAYAPHARGGGGRNDYAPSAPAPASVVAARSITNETDRAYQESLIADREKAAKSRAEKVAKEMMDAERFKEEARVKAKRDAEEMARAKIVKEAAEALPDEPGASDEGVVNIAFKMPDGSRVTRRFLSSHSAQSLFSFIDGYEKLHAGSSRLAVEPGTYRLVAQHPRRVIEKNTPGSIESAGLMHKQETLMLDLI